MDTTKITGTVRIFGGKITIEQMSFDDVEIPDAITRLLALRDAVQKGLENFEKDTQASFANLPKIPNQYDLEVMINEVEKEKKLIKCNCECHTNPDVVHMVACCNNGYYER